MGNFRSLLALLALLVPHSALFAEEPEAEPLSPSTVSLRFSPAVDIPLLESSDLFRVYPCGRLAVAIHPPSLPAFSLGVDAGYAFLPIKNGESLAQSLSMFSAGLGLGVRIAATPRVYAIGRFAIGYTYGFMNSTTPFRPGGSLFLQGAVGVGAMVTKVLDLEATVGYRNHLGLVHGIALTAGLGFRLPRAPKAVTTQPTQVRPEPLEQSQGAELEMEDVRFAEIFPVFHKHYDDHPVGSAVLRNTGTASATDVKVTLEIKPYMTAPKTCSVQSEIPAGEARPVDLFALFSEEKILAVTEGSKASAEIIWEYSVGGRGVTRSRVDTVRILNRNAMTWEDDRRAAAFVTALDPAVLSFSKNVVGAVSPRSGGAVSANLLTAIAIYEAVCLYGMSYWADPKTPYAKLSVTQTEVDFLQFPSQTLQYRAGDCDDLSILFAALFESLGIETAFITVPGHILMAVALEMEPEAARRMFLRPDELVIRGQKVWLPIEVTDLEGNFLRAWQTGAKEWREAHAEEKATVYPIHEAWVQYEPVGLPAAGPLSTAVADAELLREAYQRELERFVDRETYQEVTKLQEEIRRSQDSSRTANKLGVLYARYGLLDRAGEQFQNALASRETVSVLINLGNLHYLQGDLEESLVFYTRASVLAPDNTKLLASLARIHHEQENYGMAQNVFQKLRDLDPDLAREYAYLDLRGEEATRAAEATGTKGIILWAEE